MSLTRLPPSLGRARTLAPILYSSSSAHLRITRRHFASDNASSSEASTSSSEPPSTTTHEGWLFVDSVFPIQFGSLDLRRYIALGRKDHLVNEVKNTLSPVNVGGFKILALEPRVKDGGVFVQFSYKATSDNASTVLEAIERDLRKAVEERGGFPTWMASKAGTFWLVKGQPWKEDMKRYATNILRVAFEGPDLQEEELYGVMRRYGRIQDLTPPQPGVGGSLRFARVTFTNLRSATVAHNVMHSAYVTVGSDPSMTRLRTMYERPIEVHVIRDWASAHPRIVLPILFFLIGTLTYTIFDPIRVFSVEAKMLGWLDYQDYKIFQWLRSSTLNTLERFSLARKRSEEAADGWAGGAWKERRDAEAALRNYMSDLPTSIAFVHGPQGSGKSRMLNSITKETDRKVLVIDCAVLYKASSDMTLVSAMAKMVGYWPSFPFVNSVNNMIDLASVGLIGQKTGLSSSMEDQLKQILEVATSGFQGVINTKRKSAAKRAQERLKAAKKDNNSKPELEKIAEPSARDGRLDTVSGNGVVSELGGGGEEKTDEKGWIGEATETITTATEKITTLFGMGDKTQETKDAAAEKSGPQENGESEGGRRRNERSPEDLEAVGALPVVIIKNYATKGGKEVVLSVLADWAATLVTNQLAHVIVVSDNRENSKRLAQALPSKPMTFVALYDADAETALSFVRQRLRDANIDDDLSAEQVTYIERLGGRSVDLESLVHKVRSGQSIQESVEDIINRGVSELRKNAFGDDAEDAKNLAWSREQAWTVLHRLSKQDEIPYHNVLVEFPFKGDETALRSMEHAELITIGTQGGRPTVIRAGKPVYHYVFERLVSDPIFKATQEIAYNEKVIASAESTIKACEDELLTLDRVERLESRPWFGGRKTLSARVEYLLDKMQEATAKVEGLEKKNNELKKLLAKGG